MDKTIEERIREEVKQFIEVVDLDEERQERYLRLLPKMNGDQLRRVRVHLKRLVMIKASQETIDEIIEKKEVPEDEGGILEKVLAKVMEKAEKVEERTKRALVVQVFIF